MAVLPSSFESKLQNRKNHTSIKTKMNNIPLDQDKLVGLHTLHVLPLMIGVIPHLQRLPVVIRVLQRTGNKVVLDIDAPVVAERERPVPRWVVDGTPKVDDLEAVLQELRGVADWEVPMYASSGGRLGLVDMDLRHRLPLLRAVVDLTGTATTDSCTYRC